MRSGGEVTPMALRVCTPRSSRTAANKSGSAIEHRSVLLELRDASHKPIHPDQSSEAVECSKEVLELRQYVEAGEPGGHLSLLQCELRPPDIPNQRVGCLPRRT